MDGIEPLPDQDAACGGQRDEVAGPRVQVVALDQTLGTGLLIKAKSAQGAGLSCFVLWLGIFSQR